VSMMGSVMGFSTSLSYKVLEVKIPAKLLLLP